MSVSQVIVPCIKGKCCRPSTSTEFDSTPPTELNGIISPDEFRSSIARINASLKRPKWTYRVQTAGRILIVIGFLLLLFAGAKFLHHRHHHKHHHRHHHHPHHRHNCTSDAVVPAPMEGAGEAVAQFSVNEPSVLAGHPEDEGAWQDPRDQTAEAPVAEREDEDDDEEEEEEEGEEVQMENKKEEEEDDEEDDDDKEDDEQKNGMLGKRRHHGRKPHHKRHHKRHHKKHKKCIKHIFISSLISLATGFALCRWIACKKVRQLITRVVPAVCAEHHAYTSASRAVPVSWSLEERSICKYNCKNNALKLVLDLHTTVPLSQVSKEQRFDEKVGEQQMMTGSAYVPLNTNEQA